MNLLDKIFDAGVVGAGGAGFPTHIKLNCKVEYFIVNAIECEPLLSTDKYVIKMYAKNIISATEEISKHVSAKETYIAIKAVNTNEINALNDAINEMNSFVKLALLDNYYPAGDEQMIVYDITKRTVKEGGIPLDVGVLISNVSTVLNIYDAIDDKPVTDKFLTVNGEINNPTVLKVPIGTSIKECIDLCNGATIDDYLIITGGPMMGAVYEKDEADKLFITKTTSGILLVQNNTNFISKLKHMEVSTILNRAKSACIQCSFCSDLCPRNLTGHRIRPNKVMRYMSSLDFNKEIDYNETTKEALLCSECGVCETFSCPMGLSPRQVNKFVKSNLLSMNKRFEKNDDVLIPSAFREYRKIKPSQIMARMGLSSLYENEKPSFLDYNTTDVRIPLKQHIGIPATPCVKVSDNVSKGQIIATGSFDKVSANIHASISGVVTEVNDYIRILGGE